jgi:hypothetical protein
MRPSDPKMARWIRDGCLWGAEAAPGQTMKANRRAAGAAGANPPDAGGPTAQVSATGRKTVRTWVAATADLAVGLAGSGAMILSSTRLRPFALAR